MSYSHRKRLSCKKNEKVTKKSKSHLRTSKNQKGTEKVKIPTPASERCHAWRATDLIPKMLISGSIRNMNGSISDINGNFPDFANKQQKFSVSTRSVQYIQYFQFFFPRFDTLNRGLIHFSRNKKD